MTEPLSPSPEIRYQLRNWHHVTCAGFGGQACTCLAQREALIAELAGSEGGAMSIVVSQEYRDALRGAVDAKGVLDGVRALKAALDVEREARKRAEDALRNIAAIENSLVGGDWDEIEMARNYANAALNPTELVSTSR